VANTITAFTSFTALTKIRSAEVNTNFSNFRGDMIPIHETTATAGTTGTYNQGTDEYKWLNTHTHYVGLNEFTAGAVGNTPTSGTLNLYGRTDGNLYTKNSGGTEKQFQPANNATRTITAADTLTSIDSIIFADASAAAFTITFPTASANDGRTFYIKKIDPNFDKNVTFSPALDGITNTALSMPQEAIKVVSDGTGYNILEHYLPPARSEEKFLAGNFTSTGSMSDLTFSNLITNNWYRLTGQIFIVLDNVSSDGDASVNIVHNSITKGVIRYRVVEATDTNTDQLCAGFSLLFQASAASVTFDAVSTSNNAYISGNGTSALTFARILESKDVSTTADF